VNRFRGSERVEDLKIFWKRRKSRKVGNGKFAGPKDPYREED